MLQDSRLIWKIKEGDEQALRKVYFKYKNCIFTISRSLLNEHREAEEVLGDVFIGFTRAVRHFNAFEGLKAYLVTSAINNIADRFRKKMYQISGQVRPQGPKGAAEGQQRRPEESTERGVENEEGREVTADEQSVAIVDALSNVPLQQREVLCLHLQGGLEFGQIARILAIAENTAQARYNYGMESFRNSINSMVFDKSKANHFEKAEESIRKLAWSTDEASDKKILEQTTMILNQQTHVWRGWKFVAGAVAIIAACMIIFVIGVLLRQAMIAMTRPAIVPKVEKVQPQAVKEPNRGMTTVKKTTTVKTVVTPAKSEAEETKEEFNQILLRISLEDIDGLAEIVSQAKEQNRKATAAYLLNIGTERAAEILEALSIKSEGGEPNNIFAAAEATLKKRLGITKIETVVEEKKIEKQVTVPKMVLSGHTTDLETKTPVSNVIVFIEGPTKLSTLSDANGFYHFDKLTSEGNYKISIQTKYYLDGLPPESAAEIDLNNEVETVRDFSLTKPACTVRLEVVNEANEPVRGALVYEQHSASLEEPNNPVYPWGTSERTNEKGEVLLGCFEANPTERVFIAAAAGYNEEKLSAVLNNPKETPFYRIVLKKEQPTITDSNEPL